jgi:DNA-binding CsgD family transcriptional regulator
MKAFETTIKDIRRIFKLRSEGLSLHQIAIRVNMTAEGVRKTISSIIKLVDDSNNKRKIK